MQARVAFASRSVLRNSLVAVRARTASCVEPLAALALVAHAFAAPRIAAQSSAAQVPAHALFPHPSSAPVGSASFALADLDQDGIQDAVAAPGNAALVALRGDAQGRFEPWLELDANDLSDTFALDDFDRDGRADVIAARTTAAIELFRGLGAGGFQKLGTLSLPAVAHLLARGDCDGDGVLDLAWLSGSFAFGLARGDGAFGFQPAGQHVVGDAGALACVDLDGDGRVELLHIERPTPHTGVLVRTTCDTQGVLGAPAGSYAGELAYAWTSGDLDLDGDLDVVWQDEPSLMLRVLANGGAGLLALAASTSASRRTHGLAIADANADGRPDLVSASEGALASDAAIELWIGLSTLQLGPKLEFADSPAPRGVAVLDLTADGRADIATGHAGAGARFSVLQGTAGGAFETPIAVPLSDAPLAIQHADFDRDGAADLVAIGASGVSLALANGAGGYGSTLVASTASSSGGLAILDWNLDGEPDIACGSGSAVELLSGDGHGGFASAGSFGAGFTVEWLGAADFDADGRADLAAARSSVPRIAVLPMNASGLATPLVLPAPATLGSLAIGHANADALPDLLACTTTSAAMRLYTAGAGFQFAQQSIAKAGFQREVALADLDADGDDDLVAGDGGATVWKLQSPGGGFGGAWNASSALLTSAIAVGDVHGDGRVDLVGLAESLGLVRVLAGTGGAGGASFDIGFEAVGPSQARGPLLLDADADGRLDALIGDTQRMQLLLLANGTLEAIGVASFGTGTPGCDGRGGLTAIGAPSIGGTLRIAASGAPLKSLGFGVVAANALPTGADPLGLGITLHVDVLSAPAFLFALHSDASGSASRAFVVPPDPQLALASIPLQAFWPWPASSPCTPSPPLLSTSRGLTIHPTP